MNLVKKNFAILFSQRIMGCGIESLTITYLGIVVWAGKLSRRDWSIMIDKLERRSEGWKAKLLSFGGKLVLNAVLSAISTYFLSIFIISRWAREKVDKICQRFLWGGANNMGTHYHLVS